MLLSLNLYFIGYQFIVGSQETVFKLFMLLSSAASFALMVILK